MNKHLLFILILVVSSGEVKSQNKNNVWYFGSYAGIDFNSGSPVAITGGQVNTQEGSATACDANGNILFYSDGITVWNKLHAPMPNGTGLSGGQSSTQSVVIVPLPGSSTIYYVFTTPDYASGGFYYSIVDITLQGGLGDVTGVKNVMLYTVTTEKLTYTKAVNGLDYWIISHKSLTNEFYAYHLTSSGLNLVPVISSTGSGVSLVNSIGTIKVSPNGDKLAMIMELDFTCELYDFDNSTGVITFQGILSNGLSEYTYGCEFSPDGSNLYYCSDPGGGISTLWQFDLQAGNLAAINASAVNIGTGINGFNFGTLQTGPDNKIYVAREGQDYIGCIQDPNTSGLACNYIDTAVYLNGATSQLGLPNTCDQSFYSVMNICFGDTTHFEIAANASIGGVQWLFDDSNSGAANISYLFTPDHVFTNAGLYNVQFIRYYINGTTDTNYIPLTIHSIPFISLGNDTTICNGSSIVLDPGAGFQSYLWQDSSSTPTFAAINAGAYSVLINDGFCSASDSINVALMPCLFPNAIFASSDTLVCEKSCLDFYDLSTNSPTTWQWYFPNAQPDTSTMQNPTAICFNSYGTFDVTLIACNGAGCDTLSIPAFITIFESPPQPVVTFSNDTLYCSGTATSYQWYFNSTIIPGATGTFLVSIQSGSYFCLITDSNSCPSSSNIFVVTGIHDPGFHNQLISYANPVHDLLNVYFNMPVQNALIELFDMTGRKLYGNNLKNISTGPVRIDLSSWMSGSYIMRVKSGEENFYSRIILSR